MPLLPLVFSIYEDSCRFPWVTDCRGWRGNDIQTTLLSSAGCWSSVIRDSWSFTGSGRNPRMSTYHLTPLVLFVLIPVNLRGGVLVVDGDLWSIDVNFMTIWSFWDLFLMLWYKKSRNLYFRRDCILMRLTLFDVLSLSRTGPPSRRSISHPQLP